MKEIERKYLLKSIPSEYVINRTLLIGQYYFGSKDFDTRVRYELPLSNIEDRAAEGPPVYTLTIKSKDKTDSRIEHTIFVTEEKGKELINSPLITSFVFKVRQFYNIPTIKGEVVIDHFSNEFKNKIDTLMEVEFETEEDSNSFNSEDHSWLGKEVTNDPFYRNINLANKF